MNSLTKQLNCKSYFSRLNCISFMLLGLSGAVSAEEMTSHGSHVHGEAQLTFVLDGNEAELALVTAAGNIFGFEHTPKTAEEQQQHKTQMEMLQSGRWFTPDAAANCTISGQEVRVEQDDHGHADLYANIQLLCQAPLKLTTLQFGLFELAADLKKIKTQYLVDGVAGAKELSTAETSLTLR